MKLVFYIFRDIVVMKLCVWRIGIDGISLEITRALGPYLIVSMFKEKTNKKKNKAMNKTLPFLPFLQVAF